MPLATAASPASRPVVEANASDLELQVQQARQIIDQLPSVEEQLPLVLQLVDVLSRMATVSPSALLNDLLDHAAEMAQQQPPEAQTDTWLAIADRHIALKRRPETLEALAQALDHIDAIASPLAQAQRLQHIAAKLADLLEPSRAMMALQQAEELLPSLPAAQQPTMLTALAIQYTDLGQQDKSAALLTQAQVLAQMPVQRAENAEEPPTASVAVEPSRPLSSQPWDGSVGLLGSLFSGESSRGVIALNADVDRQWERTALDLGLQLTYNVDDEVDDPDQFSARFTAEAQHYIARSWQYFVNSSIASDDLENLQLRATLFNGVGVTLLRSGDREVGLRTGVGLRYENFEEESSDLNSPSLSVGLTYRDRLLDLVQVRQSLDFDAPFGDVSDYLFRSQTSLRIPISDRWSFDQGLRLTLSGESAPDNPGLLLNFQTGLRYQF
ncbi:MAG: DUF481 domain-containing protein [Elainellaceae cyanobacterium]